MAKKATTRKAKDLSVNEMATFLVDNIPELKEAFTRADIELALDDRGWLVPGRQWTSADLDAQTRTTLVAKARLYWLRDPLAKQAVRLWTDYALGSGITYNCDDDKVMEQLDEFCKDRRNKTVMNSEGQRRSSKKLLVDGELFFAIFTENDRKTIRRIDPLQIADIICDPDDEEHVLGYRRLTATDKVLYYVDWRCDDSDKELFAQQSDPSSKGKIGDKAESNVVVYHLPFDTMLKRGNGMLSCWLDWTKEHRRFMEARVAITQALAKFAYKLQVKGGQAVVDQIKRSVESTYAQSGMTMVERHPQNAPGATWIQNSGMDMIPMPRVTGGSEARTDGDQLKLMACAGSGIMLHYFGDPSTGNLATATAMELPMLKMFSSYQQLWLDAYRDLFSIVLDEDIDEDPAVIDIDLPPILADDLQKLGTFVQQTATVFPEIKVPEVLQMLLVSLGVNNVAEVMKSIEKKRAEIDATTTANAAAASPAPNVNKTGGAEDPKGKLAQQSNGIPNNPESGYSSTEADRARMAKLTEADLSLATSLGRLADLLEREEEAGRRTHERMMESASMMIAIQPAEPTVVNLNPVINVEAAQPAQVTVNPPQVTVNPTVQVEAPKPVPESSRSITLERDKTGLVTGAKVTNAKLKKEKHGN